MMCYQVLTTAPPPLPLTFGFCCRATDKACSKPSPKCSAPPYGMPCQFRKFFPMISTTCFTYLKLTGGRRKKKNTNSWSTWSTFGPFGLWIWKCKLIGQCKGQLMMGMLGGEPGRLPGRSFLQWTKGTFIWAGIRN